MSTLTDLSSLDLAFLFWHLNSHYTAVNAQEDITVHKEVLQLSFLIWDGLPFTIAKSKGQTHWGSESIFCIHTILSSIHPKYCFNHCIYCQTQRIYPSHHRIHCQKIFSIVPATLSPIFTFSLPIATISRSLPNMLQLLPANCMQSLSAELVTFLTSMQSQFNALNKRTTYLESLAAENVQLHAQLANVRQENADLQSQLLQNNVTGSVSSSASLPAPQSTADLGTAAFTWATKTSLIFEVHHSLHTLGVDTGRLLDINFPACKVIGVLVHVQYLKEFKSQLASAKVSLVNNFNPLDPKNVADPKFANLSVSGLETQALVLQNAHCL
ncbi:hypothetical protein PHYBLDRAFT_164995 [Phycomyces blakesleeanus NRRL 1555(-)]|uniref:Uncharacterized protein n=1 Tax=Phycomyces blakesleeanus (strain ATCC 8743b / DSM 1359 / FGSC 10004 / NBRC 33097 / NRRL 1555) TaxID=763407 RepID=A0A163B3K9_PHYB8|nr:hypothetical protein PHYBLDRAFT_164995 [Phycomyces blakesleeanus NRRL 1555(-)]OAD78121.1 hypothetical protein PHYBLDRAFT_164995 [Phycomyces blakesleeanus NRRL 1555(-)]|eukprot:XP_018296161.1 hypothetical protein PHYBLDRAFT_164995 [Phycomyces blakesleeanus NRRL 1555(-)]